ncbi:MAG: hypothetical protein M1813_001720 [Trichoglossum hirsutum]|nr:MAG: hypothetical protein M1813_001720 [Trichoglossum hirsutum]
MNTQRAEVKCSTCTKIETKLKRRAREEERIKRWKHECNRSMSIAKLIEDIRVIDQEIYALQLERQKRSVNSLPGDISVLAQPGIPAPSIQQLNSCPRPVLETPPPFPDFGEHLNSLAIGRSNKYGPDGRDIGHEKGNAGVSSTGYERDLSALPDRSHQCLDQPFDSVRAMNPQLTLTSQTNSSTNQTLECSAVDLMEIEDELILFLSEDNQLGPLFKAAVNGIGPAPFERNFIGFLDRYSKELELEADSALEGATAKLIRAKSRQVAYGIRCLLSIDNSDTSPVAPHMKTQAASIHLEKILQRRCQTLKESVLRGRSGRPAPLNLQRIKDFMMAGGAFSNLRENLRGFVDSQGDKPPLRGQDRGSVDPTTPGTRMVGPIEATSLSESDLLLAIAPNELTLSELPIRPAQPDQDESLSTSNKCEPTSAGSSSTFGISLNDSVVAIEENLPPGIDPDERLTSPSYHFQRLRDLEASVYQQSALRFYGAVGIDQAGEWQSATDLQPFVPFLLDGIFADTMEEARLPKHGTHASKHPPRTNLPLLHLLDCRNLLSNSVSNLSRLRSGGFDGDCFNILTIHRCRPSVARLVPVEDTFVMKLKEAFGTAISALASVEPTEWDNAEPVLKLNQTCKRLLCQLGLIIEDDAALQRSDSRVLWRCVAHTLDLAILSYSGAHVSRLDERYLGVTRDRFSVLAPFLEGHPPAEQQCLGITMRRRSLRCLDGFLRGKQVWVFRLELSSDVSDYENDRIYLSTRITTLASIWGPLWGTSSKITPEEILEYSLGNGSIVPWPAEPDENRHITGGETFCHWISSQENWDVNIVQEGLVKRYFNGKETLLIGSGNGLTPRLRLNPSCVGTAQFFKERYRNSNCLRQTGTVRPTKSVDTQTVQIHGGGMGLSGTAGISYKIDNGQTWKEALMERWEKEPDRRNPRVLEHWFGVEVSACTENARRRRLIRILATKTMQDYLNALGFPWDDEECERQYYESLNGKSTAFRELYHAHPEWRADLAKAVVTCLKALRETGVDDRGMLSAFWVTDPDDEWVITLRKSEHPWVGLIKDTTESGSMAVLVDKCLEFDELPNCRCLSRPLENADVQQAPRGSSIFETAIAINECIKPFGLTKPQYPYAVPTSISKEPTKPKERSWDISGLRRGVYFQIGDADGKQGELTLLRDPAPDGALFVEWKTSIRPVWAIKRKFNGGFLGREVGRYHEEYILDGKWEFRKLVVHVVSRSDCVSGVTRR